MNGPNSLLDALIEEAGIKRASLAARVNALSGGSTSYDHRSVGRWVARGERPRGRAPQLICETLSAALGRSIGLGDIGMAPAHSGSGTTVPLAVFVERAPSLWRSDHNERDDVREVAPATGLDAIAPVWEWESPLDDIDVSRDGQAVVGLDHVTQLRTARGHYEEMYRRVGGLTVRPRIVSYLTMEVTPLLRGSYNHTTGQHLHRAVGGLVAVAGICTYDSDYQGLAQRYFHQALRLAKASGDRGFGGYVVALLVNQALHRRDYRQAISFAEAGLRTAGSHMSPALSTDIYAMQAKAFARVNDLRQAHASMRQTEAAAERIRRVDEPPETSYVQPGLVETQFAEALSSLGDLTAARRFADEAVAASTHPRGRVNRLATVTKIAIQSGRIDQAVDSASAMLDQANGMESRRLFERFRQLRKNMSAYGNAAGLGDIVARIDDVLAIPLE
ncbi:transcriptional regulator [Catenulispora pinisilvae]|uniref:transcriptional regulator n=1 Tax=Catenulispora pinisilvae TaxID=2705253 RepID=UPI0018921107|nr:transcriptional regulator [Catenulispora pinisilvae]